jgi:hypothetical protein
LVFRKSAAKVLGKFDFSARFFPANFSCSLIRSGWVHFGIIVHSEQATRKVGVFERLGPQKRNFLTISFPFE